MSKGDLTRNRILDEAMRLASKDGLEGLTIGTLAEALSLSKSGLFAHFGSKEALQIAVLEHTRDRFHEKAAAPLQAAAEGLPRLRALMSAWLDWIDDPELPGGCPLMGACFELDDQEGGAREKLVALQKRTQDHLTALVKETMAAGHLDPKAPIPQILFELRATTLAYHIATRVMRDPRARPHAWAAFEALVARYPAKRRGTPLDSSRKRRA